MNCTKKTNPAPGGRNPQPCSNPICPMKAKAASRLLFNPLRFHRGDMGHQGSPGMPRAPLKRGSGLIRLHQLTAKNGCFLGPIQRAKRHMFTNSAPSLEAHRPIVPLAVAACRCLPAAWNEQLRLETQIVLATLFVQHCPTVKCWGVMQAFLPAKTPTTNNTKCLDSTTAEKPSTGTLLQQFVNHANACSLGGGPSKNGAGLLTKLSAERRWNSKLCNDSYGLLGWKSTQQVNRNSLASM